MCFFFEPSCLAVSCFTPRLPRGVFYVDFSGDGFNVFCSNWFDSGYMLCQSTEAPGFHLDARPASCTRCRWQFCWIFRGLRHEEKVPVDAHDAEPASCPRCGWQFYGIFRGFCDIKNKFLGTIADAEPASCPRCGWQFYGIFRGFVIKNKFLANFAWLAT